jgi:F-type H+-transporting ATPase subunit delta
LQQAVKTTGFRQLSQRYVKALFDVSSVASAVATVEKDLLVLARVAHTSKEFSDFLKSPVLGREEQAGLVEAMLNNIGAHELTRKFCAMLARGKRLPALPEMAEIFSQTAAAARGEISAELVSAGELKPAEISAIADKLSKMVGKKVIIKTRVNPQLLGGVVVKIGSQQFDGSVAGKLQRLKNTLKAA